MVAFIPARGGSKGLPRKNILSLAGKPLICHTIDAALEARSIDRVIVTTDDPEIRSIALEGGAEAPFLRPAELATDTAKAVDVYNHALSELERDGPRIEAFCVLLPTAPLRRAVHIDGAFELFGSRNADSVLSVTAYDHPIQWAVAFGADAKITPLMSGDLTLNRQDLQQVYRPNGAIYFFRREFWDLRSGYYGDRSYGYFMPPRESVDIDTRDDFQFAEYLLGNP